MKIISNSQTIVNKTSSVCCIIHSIHVQVMDIKQRANEIITTISDVSWINALSAVQQHTFMATAERTIQKLVEDILNQVTNIVTIEFGEYMVSDTAQESLKQVLSHSRVPLAELLKEKVSGNPGFDFHTESHTSKIVFGESKFSSESNPYRIAIEQIESFIDLKKDEAELLILEGFVSKKAMTKALSGDKSYAMAFSINAQNPDTIMNNAQKLCTSKNISYCTELYLIGVEICE